MSRRGLTQVKNEGSTHFFVYSSHSESRPRTCSLVAARVQRQHVLQAGLKRLRTDPRLRERFVAVRASGPRPNARRSRRNHRRSGLRRWPDGFVTVRAPRPAPCAAQPPKPSSLRSLFALSASLPSEPSGPRPNRGDDRAVGERVELLAATQARGRLELELVGGERDVDRAVRGVTPVDEQILLVER
jgi:hypothetical protein